MIDVVLGSVLVGLLVRGWLRGFVREVVGLVVVVVGTLLAFRLSVSVGSVVAAMAGTSPDVSRLIGGVAVFLLVSIGGALVSFAMHRGIRVLPGLPTANRVAGAGLAGIGGLVVATVAVSALALMSLPDSVSDRLEGSTITRFLTEPGAPPQEILSVLAGDRVASTVLDLRDLVGDRHLVGTADRIALPPAERGDLEHRIGASGKVYDLVNKDRVEAGADPLARFEPLDDLARVMAFDVYTTGRFVIMDDLERRVEAAGIPVVSAVEVLGLGATAPSVHEGLVRKPDVARTLSRDGYRRMGVAAVDGPLGLVTVVILAA